MHALAILLICLIRNRFRSAAEIEAENIALRHQLNVLLRKAPKVRLAGADRALFVFLYRLFPSVLDAIAIVKPETVLRWHRAGFRAWWRWKSRNCGGRPRIGKDIRALIRRMHGENPLWGAPRIHGELRMLGFDVSEATVSRYMAMLPRRRGQTWKTFLRNHEDCIAAADFLVVPTIRFELLYVLVILRHARRTIAHLAVTRHPTADWIARQIVEAFPWDTAPAYFIRDNDCAYGEIFRRRLRSMGIRDHPTAVRSPWQNGHVERVIGSIRRECLDHMVVRGEAHLHRILASYVRYYNQDRTHLALAKDAPHGRQIERAGSVTANPILGGLHHRYVRIAF
jgi:transposase InsO family protein